MTDLWRHLAQSEPFATFSLAQDTAAGLAQAPFAESFAAAMDKAEREGRVQPPARRLLQAFADGCGRTDLTGQQAHIEYYRGLLAAQEEEARREYAEKGRVYRVLGLTGGVALMLLLM